eukprot:FR737607.1.p2 GENE.FR737607.1~~FR737607.1.p2  ORF type:complete len:171 (+),score=26.90 FR737607.1:377-889(+)
MTALRWLRAPVSGASCRQNKPVHTNPQRLGLGITRGYRGSETTRGPLGPGLVPWTGSATYDEATGCKHQTHNAQHRIKNKIKKKKKKKNAAAVSDSQGPEPRGSTSSRATATAVELQLLFPFVRVNCPLGVLPGLAVFRGKLLSRSHSPHKPTPNTYGKAWGATCRTSLP